MNIIKRTCANCAAFNPAPEGDDPTCWNLVSIVIQHFSHGKPQARARQPGLDDHCDYHQTHDEDRAEDAAISMFWQRLGIEPRLGQGKGAS